jgi:hypothetical protein
VFGKLRNMDRKRACEMDSAGHAGPVRYSSIDPTVGIPMNETDCFN